VGIADGSAVVFVAEELFDSRKSFPTWLRSIVAAVWRNLSAVISPTPMALQAARSRRLNARLENGVPEYPANRNSDSAKMDPSRSENPHRSKGLLNVLSLRERRTHGARNRHIVEDAPLAFNPQSHNFLFLRIAIGPGELTQFIKPPV